MHLRLRLHGQNGPIHISMPCSSQICSLSWNIVSVLLSEPCSFRPCLIKGPAATRAAAVAPPFPMLLFLRPHNSQRETLPFPPPAVSFLLNFPSTVALNSVRLLDHETFMKSQIRRFPQCATHMENKHVSYHTRHQRKMEIRQFLQQRGHSEGAPVF